MLAMKRIPPILIHKLHNSHAFTSFIFYYEICKRLKKNRQECPKKKNLARLHLKYEEGSISNFLKMKPSKFQVGDPEAQSILDVSLASTPQHIASNVLMH